eukprot:4608720-Pleurochrysis_carterae.AAC.1
MVISPIQRNLCSLVSDAPIPTPAFQQRFSKIPSGTAARVSAAAPPRSRPPFSCPRRCGARSSCSPPPARASERRKPLKTQSFQLVVAEAATGSVCASSLALSDVVVAQQCIRASSCTRLKKGNTRTTREEGARRGKRRPRPRDGANRTRMPLYSCRVSGLWKEGNDGSCRSCCEAYGLGRGESAWRPRLLGDGADDAALRQRDALASRRRQQRRLSAHAAPRVARPRHERARSGHSYICAASCLGRVILRKDCSSRHAPQRITSATKDY